MQVRRGEFAASRAGDMPRTIGGVDSLHAGTVRPRLNWLLFARCRRLHRGAPYPDQRNPRTIHTQRRRLDGAAFLFANRDLVPVCLAQRSVTDACSSCSGERRQRRVPPWELTFHRDPPLCAAPSFRDILGAVTRKHAELGDGMETLPPHAGPIRPHGFRWSMCKKWRSGD